MKLHNLLFVFFISYVIPLHANDPKADLLIFSFNRPLQLYALLESLDKYVSGLDNIAVLYLASSPEFSAGYDVVKEKFAQTKFVKQELRRGYCDFKDKTLQILNSFNNQYILFSVDDIIVKDYIDIAACIDALNKSNAYAFYLRLGKNITYCYTRARKQTVREFCEVVPGIYRWNFKDGVCEFAWHNSLDMTLYRKTNILPLFNYLSFNNPNSLENIWISIPPTRNIGLCFSTSKIVNIPLNRVNNVYQTRFMNYASPNTLLKIFNERKKMDINPLFNINNNSPHIEYIPTFIDR